MHGPAPSAARGQRTALSSQVRRGGGGGGGDGEALPLKRGTRPVPAPGSRGALPLGHGGGSATGKVVLGKRLLGG